MFIVRWVRTLLSLPILWLGQLALNFNTPASIGLLSAAWAVGRDAEVGRSALAAIQRLRGRDTALAQARHWLERHPRPHFAAFAGLMALEGGDAEGAKAFLARGRELDDDPMGGLDWLEYLIAHRSEQSVLSEVARRFEMRKDLPPDLTKTVLTELMFDDLMNGRLEGAKLRAERLVEVAEDPPSEMVLWAVATHADDSSRAERHLGRADMPPAQKSYYQFMGYLAIGRSAEAREVLTQLRDQDEALAHRAEGILKAKEAANVSGNDAPVPSGPAGGDHGA